MSNGRFFCSVLSATRTFAVLAVVLPATLFVTGCATRLSEAETKALDEAKTFLAAGGDINVKDDAGMTRMRHAVWNGHAAAMRFLISRGTNLRERDRFGYHLLHAAALQGHLEAMELLIEHGAEIDARALAGGYTPLHLAAWEGSIDTARLLVRHKANVDAKGNWNLTPLFFAAASGNYKVAEFLISRGAAATACTTGGIRPLYLAAGGRHLILSCRNAICFCLDPTTDQTGMFIKPRTWFEGDHDKVVRLLVKSGAKVDSVNYPGTTPLHLASGAGNLRAVQALLELGADPSLRMGADVWDLWGRPSYSALDCAVWTGVWLNREQGGKLVETLIRAGAKVNQHDGTGKTPLHHAVESVHLDAIKALLKAGANVNGVDKKFVRKDIREVEVDIAPSWYMHNIGGVFYGQTPLFTALRVDFSRFWDKKLRARRLAQRLEVVKLLLNKGADTAAQLPDGATPLHIAMFHANPEEMAEFLLAHGADVNATDKKLATPLHYAVVREPAKWSQKAIKPGLVRMLVKKGARLNVRTKARMTPLDWAVEFEHELKRRDESGLRTDTGKEVIVILEDAESSEEQDE